MKNTAEHFLQQISAGEWSVVMVLGGFLKDQPDGLDVSLWDTNRWREIRFLITF